MKKALISSLIKTMICGVTLILVNLVSHAQVEDFEHLSSREFHGDVVRIEERKFYKEGKDDPYKLSDIEVFRYHEGKLMDAYQKINRAEQNRTFRKFIYTDQGQLREVEISSNSINAPTQKLAFSYDGTGNVVKVQKHRGKNISFVTYAFDTKSRLVKKARTNERGRLYQEESFSYNLAGELLAWESKDLVMKTKSTKDYSYAEEDGLVTTTTKQVDFDGTTGTEYVTKNSSGLKLTERYETPSGIGNYDMTSQYAMDKNGNWVRLDRLRSNHRISYTLRQITYADGTVTGHLEALPGDAYVEWRREGQLLEIQVDGKSIRKNVKSSYLLNSPDVLAHDLSSGLSFIMEGYKNDSSYTWKPALAVKENVDLYWVATDESLRIYHKGNPSSKSVSMFVNDDVLLYLPSAHQSFLLKGYRAKMDSKVHAAEALAIGTNAFWFKMDDGSFRLIINGAYAEGALPNEWLNSTDIVINDEGGKPRFAMKGYDKAIVGKIYPATPYN